MSKENDVLQEVIDYLELENGFDKEEIISEMLEEMAVKGDIEDDELDIETATKLYDKIIIGVCNVLRSFKS